MHVIGTIMEIFKPKVPDGEAEKTGGYRLWFSRLTSGHQI